MLKLYRTADSRMEYWETWQDVSGDHVIHWGELGTEGESKTIPRGLLGGGRKIVEQEITGMRSRGFTEIDPDDHHFLSWNFGLPAKWAAKPSSRNSIGWNPD